MKWIRVLKRVGSVGLGLISPELLDILNASLGGKIPASVEDAIKSIAYGIAFFILIELRSPKDEPDQRPTKRN